MEGIEMAPENNDYTKNQKQFINIMLDKIPGASHIFNEKLDGRSADDISFYVALSPFVDLVIDSSLNENQTLIKKILSFVEDFLLRATNDDKTAVSICFFEDIINLLSHEDPKHIRKFVSMLGPHSRECCKIVDEFWGVKTPGLYDDEK